MKKFGLLILCGQLIALSVLASDQDYKNGSGGNIPSSTASNAKVELADGETYSLAGEIVFNTTDQPFLKIDLKKHPWLANAQRVKSPFYQLSGGSEFWKRFANTQVQYTCLAQGVISPSGSGYEYSIILTPVKATPDDSMVDRISPRKKN